VIGPNKAINTAHTAEMAAGPPEAKDMNWIGNKTRSSGISVVLDEKMGSCRMVNPPSSEYVPTTDNSPFQLTLPRKKIEQAGIGSDAISVSVEGNRTRSTIKVVCFDLL
jgi:hypothetical protein